MPIVTLVPPEGYPVSLAEAKEHLRVEDDDENGAIGRAIAAATSRCETFCQTRFVAQQLRWATEPPGADELVLPLAAVRAVDAVAITTAEGEFSLVRDAYRLGGVGDRITRIKPTPGFAWPLPVGETPVAVTMVVGDPVALVPPDVKAAVLLLVARLFENRQGEADMTDTIRGLLGRHSL